VGKHIIAPIVEDNFLKFRSPNNYSLLLMSLGYQFITDPKYDNRRDRSPGGPSQPMTEEGKPFRYSIFSRFAYEIKTKHFDLLTKTDDLPLLSFILQTYILNNSLD
jgi:hypothetical protein